MIEPNLKGFVVSYESQNNLFKGKKFISAPTLREAQNTFFTWLRDQEVYSHLWKLNIDIEEVQL